MNGRIARAIAWFCAGSAVALLATWNAPLPSRAACNEAPCAAPPCCNGDVNGDGVIDLSDAIGILSYLFGQGGAPVAITVEDKSPNGPSLPATGQHTCYNLVWPAIACDTAEFPGQDGFYQSGCPMLGRYVDHGDGTVTDTCTGLMWQKMCAPERLDWQQALHHCEQLTLGGHEDWRLPNVRELQSIVDYGRDHPCIDPVFAAAMSWYWSSSTLAVTPSDAWTVCFGYGGAVLEFNKTGTFHVRAVRSP